ncbi:hypothetical protein [Acidaminobacterium chupaoyuni]
MNGKKKKYKTGRVIGLVFVILLFLILCLLTYSAFRPFSLLPQGLNWQAAPVAENTLKNSLPKGSLAMIDRLKTPHQNDMAAYRENDQIKFGRVAEEKAEGYQLQNETDSKSVFIDRVKIYGAVPYYIANLGALLLLLNEFRLTMVAVCALYLVFWLLFLATAPARRKMRKKKELMELFEFYGEKYDIEEAGIDY